MISSQQFRLFLASLNVLAENNSSNDVSVFFMSQRGQLMVGKLRDGTSRRSTHLHVRYLGWEQTVGTGTPSAPCAPMSSCGFSSMAASRQPAF